MILTKTGTIPLKRTKPNDWIIVIALIAVIVMFAGLTLLRGEFTPTLTPTIGDNTVQMPGGVISVEPSGEPSNTMFQTPRQMASQAASQVPAEVPSQQPSQSPIDAKPLPVVVNDLGQVGTYAQGSRVEIVLEGPLADGTNHTANPFRLPVDVIFSGPDGQVYQVPAFFDGDGAGGMQGTVWKVRFRPDAPGEWKFVSTSSETKLAGYGGQFEVTPIANTQGVPNQSTDDFNVLGTLRYDGGYYLRFSNGEYWIKAGIDDPENFLGDAIGDWDAKKAAVDYLSSKGVNSIYIITMNIDGDRKDTWPWVGETQQEAKANSDTFDVAKLQQWEDLFTYIQSKGIVLHIVLTDDSAWDGFNHDLYYREMVARFGHHPALIWNIGEEANEIYTNQEQIDLAGKMKNLDTYDHPVAVHRLPIWPFFGNGNFDTTSIQPIDGGKDFTRTELGDQNGGVILHRERSASAGRPIPIMIDELPRVTQVTEATRLKMRSKVLYPIYFGGGNFELHFYDVYGQGGTLSFQDLAPMLDDMRRVRELIETLPFHAMQPCDGLVSGSGTYCFGRHGIVYAIYLPTGGSISVDLPGANTTYNVSWFDPRTGERHNVNQVMGGAEHSFHAPDSQDWVLILQNPTGIAEGGLTYFLPFVSANS